MSGVHTYIYVYVLCCCFILGHFIGFILGHLKTKSNITTMSKAETKHEYIENSKNIKIQKEADPASILNIDDG